MRKNYLLFIVFSWLLSNHVQAQQTDVVPTANTTTDGGGSFIGPLTNTARSYQFIINENQLTNVLGREITAITFRLQTGASAAWPASAITYSNYDIYLSPSVAPAARSTTWGNNIVGTQTQVRSGSLNISAGAFPAGGTPNNFGSSIDFNTPYLYTGGHLLVEVRHSATTSGSSSNSVGTAATTGYGTNFAQYWTGTYTPTATTTGGQGNFSVIQFISQATGPCTTPPTSGNAVSNKTNVCSGETFNLSLSGNSTGNGQTYQWQSSLTGNAPWANVGTMQTAPSVTFNQTATTFYRCGLTCGTSLAYSDSVKITSPSLVGGTFSINNAISTGGTNFASFGDAINYIKCGINAPVVFNVEPGSGPYTEQIVIPQIFGTSTTNTITVKGNGATLNYGSLATTSARSGITLNGADHVIMDSLIIDGSAGTFAWGVTLTNQADSNIVKNCTINIGNLTSTSTNFIGVVINGSVSATATSGNNGNGNLFEKNTINGGYYGYYLYGSSTANNMDNVVKNNIILDNYAYGVYMLYQTNARVSQNDISRPLRTTSTTVAGVYASTGTLGALIEKNRIHNLFDGMLANTSAAYPIYLGASGTAALINRVENNLIYNINSNTGTTYGIYGSATSYSYWNIYHNTIVLDNAASTAGTTYGIYFYGAAGVNIKNNIVLIGRGGTGTKYCLYYSTVGVTSSNNNVLLNTSTTGTTNSIGFYNAGYATFAAWQAANSAVYDQQSVNTDPLFTNAGSGDYTPSSPAINDIGAVATGVTTDILGITRTTNPDPGAYEFSLSGCTNPPTPGAATSTQSNVCSGVSFTLDLSGNSIGDGQTYTWQSSPNNAAPWTDVSPAQTLTSFTTNQTSSLYYRCAVKCNSGTTVFSTSIFVTTPAAVFGTFTINSGSPASSTNFQTFAAAIDYIKCSIGGPVVFNVVAGSGPYNEQIIIPEINGSSSTNTITINGNGETLNYTSTVTSERAVLKLNGTDYVTINNLHIIAGGSATTEYGYGVQLVNDADNNTIKNCIIDITQTPATAASTAFAGIVINATAATSPIVTGDSKCDNNTITNNTITGGYLGISLVANGATNTINTNKVLKNNISEFYLYGVYVNGNNGALIDSNMISRPTRASVSNFDGVYFTGVSTNSIVSRNRLYNPFGGAATSTSAGFCIYFNSASAIVGNENIISNNLIYDHIGSTGNHNGILINLSSYLKVYHNTIVLNDVNATCAACAARGIYVQGTTPVGLDFKNNIIDISQGGDAPKQCMFFEPTTVTAYSLDGNNYRNTSTGGTLNEIARVGGSSSTATQGTGYTTINDWQTGSAQEANSKSEDPLFTNPSIGDFKPLSSVIDNIGLPVGITTDILGLVRSNTAPDAGAYEFSNYTAGVNLGAEALVTPAVVASGCYTNAEAVTVRIRNSSTGNHDFVANPVTVTINVTGTVTQTFTTIVNTGSLATGATLNVLMPGTLNMSATGVYTFNANTSLVGDVNAANDAMSPVNRTKIELFAGTVTASPPGYCATGGTPTLTMTGATGFTSFQWQTSTTSGTGFSNISGANTSPYTLGTAITQTSYYKLNAVCGTTTVSSAEAMVEVSNPQIIATTPGTRCGSGTVNLSATPSNGATVDWYDAITGGNLVASGNNFTTPSLATTTDFFASASGGNSLQSYNVGYTTTANYSFLTQTVGWGFMFTANTNCSLQSVTVYPTGTGTITIKVLDLSNNVLFSGPVTNITGSGASTPVVVPVGATLTPGNYKLGMSSTGVTNLGSQPTGGSFAYPFVSTPLTITAGSQGSGAVAAVYYWLYDWVVTTGSLCVSNPRTAVTATIDNSPTCVVPVTLLSFKGERKGMVNQLEWSTATEINNTGFELQRSADGINFSKLAFVKNKSENGNSSTKLNYKFSDENPLAATSYYRLKQIDKDGRSTISNIVAIKGLKPYTLALVNVYPNPAKDNLNISLISPKADRVTLIITDITGKVVERKTVQLATGDNTLQLNVTNLTQGSYMLKAVCADGCETTIKKFVKG